MNECTICGKTSNELVKVDVASVDSARYGGISGIHFLCENCR